MARTLWRTGRVGQSSKFTTAIAAAVGLGWAGACSEAPTEAKSRVPSTPHLTVAPQPCYEGYDCDGTWGHSMGSGGGGGCDYYYSNCLVSPLTSYERSAITAALGRINFGCGHLKNVISGQMSSGLMGSFQNQSIGEWGDAHIDEMGKPIHIWTGTFSNPRELAVTLMHEAYHVYHNSRDEYGAEITAQSCVPAS